MKFYKISLSKYINISSGPIISNCHKQYNSK